MQYDSAPAKSPASAAQNNFSQFSVAISIGPENRDGGTTGDDVSTTWTSGAFTLC
jgi:hypothetical protein